MPDEFEFTPFAKTSIVDAHIHVPADLDPSTLWETLERTGALRCNALSVAYLRGMDMKRSTLNNVVLRFKAASDGRAFAFGALDYSDSSSQTLHPHDLVEQARRLVEQGFDGIKMWEGKPAVYIHLPDHLDGPLFEPFFAWVEEHSFPLLMHVADPPRLWNPARAKIERWSYAGKGYPTREELYAQLERILDRHPRLRIILAHFLFLWDALPRAARFLDAHPSVALDLTPAVEGYLQLSDNASAARDFFVQYQDRIIYGTDIGAGPIVDPSMSFDAMREAGQSWLVRAFLETSWDIPLPAHVGAVTNQFVGRHVRGIALFPELLAKIYRLNFERMVGRVPRPLP